MANGSAADLCFDLMGGDDEAPDAEENKRMIHVKTL
jgi:hypothetical protein